MKTLFTSAGTVLLVTSAVLVPSVAQAQNFSSDPAQEKEISPEPTQEQEITSESSPKGNGYGLVQFIGSQALEVREANGDTQVYPLGEGVTAPENIGPGDLIVFNTTREGIVKDLQSIAEEEVYEGVIDKIDGENVTILPDGGGDARPTIIQPQTASRLGIAEGERVRVTQYAGIGTTRVCALPTPVVEQPEPEIAPPGPFTGREEPITPPAPIPIPALW